MKKGLRVITRRIINSIWIIFQENEFCEYLQVQLLTMYCVVTKTQRELYLLMANTAYPITNILDNYFLSNERRYGYI